MGRLADMAQLQYKTEKLKSMKAIDKAMDELTNQYGFHGWRVVAVVPQLFKGNLMNVYVTFEREAPVEA